MIDRIVFERADIADLEVMDRIYRRYRPGYVVNFAAESHNDRAILGPSVFMRSNALGAQVLAECSRLMPVTSHVHMSTIEVYGELVAGQQWFTERSPLNAKTPTVQRRQPGDQIIRAYMATCPECNIRLTRCADNYGPYQLPEKLIPFTVTNLLRGRKIPVYGDGLQSRDWPHVADHCAAVHRMLHADLGPIPAAAGIDPGLLPIFDISARCEVTNLDIARRIAAALDLDPDEWIEHIPDRPNHDRRYLIDPPKLETELRWQPEHEFEAGIAETTLSPARTRPPVFRPGAHHGHGRRPRSTAPGTSAYRRQVGQVGAEGDTADPVFVRASSGASHPPVRRGPHQRTRCWRVRRGAAVSRRCRCLCRGSRQRG